MEIYVVQPGDTIETIAEQFNVSTIRLMIDNAIESPYQLVIGQTLVIAYPTQVYDVKEGDTLGSIAETFNVPVMQLLRNNSFLTERENIYPGETLVISYDNNLGHIETVGYTYDFIKEDILNKTLPLLSYLPVFNYHLSLEGQFLGSDRDILLIETAQKFDVVVTLVVSAYSDNGQLNSEAASEVLSKTYLQDEISEVLLKIISTKDYNGINLAFQLVTAKNQQLYYKFLEKVWNMLHPLGYYVFLTMNPGIVKDDDGNVTFEKINYTAFSELSDGILFLSYDLGFIKRPPNQFSIITTSALLDYIVLQVPRNKIAVALPTLGYDWKLPYIPGETKASALTFDSALSLARQVGARIKYDEETLSAYFEYIDNTNKNHIVYFKDARSIDSSLKILKSYGISAIGIWNIMYYFAQMWLVINTQYQIDKVI